MPKAYIIGYNEKSTISPIKEFSVAKVVVVAAKMAKTNARIRYIFIMSLLSSHFAESFLLPVICIGHAPVQYLSCFSWPEGLMVPPGRF